MSSHYMYSIANNHQGRSLQRSLNVCYMQVSESRLISLLEQVNEHSSSKTKVTIQRRRALDDDY